MVESGIKIIEDGIIELLETGLRATKIPVKPFSENFKKNDFLYARDEVLVQYTGTQYDTPGNFTPGCIQKEHKKFDITVISRDLRSSAGAYEIIDRIKVILFGNRIKSGEKIILIADFFTDYQEEVWIYTVQIKVITNYIKER